MNWLKEPMDWLDAVTAGEGVRVLLSVLVIVGAGLGLRLRRSILARDKSVDAQERRNQLVLMRNLVTAVSILALAVLWGYKLTGFIFSLAAVAGALVIVNKELIQGLTGYGFITLTKPYRVGDYIQVSRFTGRVLDIRLLGTTLAETGSVHQLTGMTVTVPNSMLLTEAVRNMSATGDYLVNLYRIPLPFAVDISKAETLGLEAAEAVTAPWRVDAEAHLLHKERSEFLDLPSARPKILWETSDSKTVVMVVRFACPAEKRVTAEQEVFREFWRRAVEKNLLKEKPSETVASEG